MRKPKFGIIGDFQSRNATHTATNSALIEAGPCSIEWLATDRSHDYGSYDGFVCSPGSPYKNEAGALEAIRYAREHQVALLGTCGGFQHIVLEFARNVAGIADAAHAENDPYASVLFLTRLTCSLVGQTMSVSTAPRTLAHQCYLRESAEESYYCNFGLNPEYRETLINAGLRVSGTDEAGEVRIVELPGHPFFMGTLFVPQTRERHPLIEAFYKKSARA